MTTESTSNVVLVGLTGCGKSTIGWHLAQTLGLGFLDLDEAIVKTAGKPIHRIFAEDGEEAFRRLERETVERIEGIRSHVIAAGGGAVVDDENWRRLSALGVTLWIHASPEEIARRLTTDRVDLATRPLLADLAQESDRPLLEQKLADRLRGLLLAREFRYRLSRFVIETAYSTPGVTTSLINRILKDERVLIFSEKKNTASQEKP